MVFFFEDGCHSGGASLSGWLAVLQTLAGLAVSGLKRSGRPGSGEFLAL